MSNLYIPPYARTLDKAEAKPQIRLGLQGAPKTGKTFGALTFPNPVVLNLDRGLGAHQGRKDVMEVPLYQTEILKKFAADGFVKSAVENWMQTEAPQFTAEQTLVIDGSTGLQNAFHKWYAVNPEYTRGGSINEFGEWRKKLEFFSSIIEQTKYLKCNVIYICHEVDAKDKKTGEYTGKIKPLLTGSFGDELASHFSDWFRVRSGPKKKEADLKPEALAANWRMTPKEFIAMQDTFKDSDAIYFFQTFPDDESDCGNSSLLNAPRFIPATYESFLKYMRKPTMEANK